MKYYLMCCWLLMLGISTVFGQPNILIADSFEDNRNDWQLVSNEYYSFKVANGSYMLETKQEYYRNIFKYLYINPKNDFYIESKMILTKQDKGNYGYGLIWGASYAKQYYFCISKTGYYVIYEYNSYKDKKTKIIDWKQSKTVRPIGDINTLGIRKTGNNLIFSINGTNVETMPFRKFYGSYLGFFVSANTQLEVHDFSVKSQKTPINVIKNASRAYKKENLGGVINSSAEEIHPIISQDGKTLYFTRDGHPENIGAKKLQDSWYAQRKGNSWSVPKKMEGAVNNEGHNSLLYVSPDGNTLVVDHDEGDELNDKQAIYELKRTKSGWSYPKEVQINSYYNYNKYESFCFSPSGNILISSLEREDSEGGTDLYVSFLTNQNTWSKPKNMGRILNTFADDFTPFIAADGKTLYYASEGFSGYGSADIYMSKRLDNTWTNWTSPQNLGSSINGKGWDAYYTIDASGEEAFLVSNGQYGGSDIFKIKLAESAKPEPVVLIEGRVLDAKTKQGISANIVYEDLKTGKKLGKASSNPKTGAYKIVLPYGKHYGFRAEAKGYISINENIEITKQKDYQKITRNLTLAALKKGEVVELKNVFFKRGTTTLLEKSYPELERLVEIMKENATLEIELKGHTDNVGNPITLMKLSQIRAETVVNYLAEKGIDKSRLLAKGYGGTQPVASNVSEETRKLNRRVEFKITKL